MRDSERRLDDVLTWWAARGSPLLSVQRTTTMLRRFPPSTAAAVALFAAAAAEAGDGRWRTLARAVDGVASLASRGKRGGEPRLTPGPALMLRLRAGFGVGVKADLLAILLAMGGTDATVRSLSEASGYTLAAVRRAAREMEAAALVQGTHSRPASYYVDPERWTVLLEERGTGDGHGWRSFAQIFAFLAWVGDWGDEQRDASAYVASSAARDLFEKYRGAFEFNRISVPEPHDYPGAGYCDAFGETVRTVCMWVRGSL
jgi:hypothetical protein